MRTFRVKAVLKWLVVAAALEEAQRTIRQLSNYDDPRTPAGKQQVNRARHRVALHIPGACLAHVMTCASR
jgi:hypothetical protein